ncbi:MAG: 4-oxalocrotonate tautomerase [Pseudomonadota bacterium]
MPLYNLACRHPLRPDQRRDVAVRVTDAHCEATTALPHYVNVVFTDNWSLPPGIDVSIFGGVRIGGTRTPEVIETLKRALVDAVATGIGQSSDSVSISTIGVPANWIIEGGEVMPDPGDEPGAAELIAARELAE